MSDDVYGVDEVPAFPQENIHQQVFVPWPNRLPKSGKEHRPTPGVKVFQSAVSLNVEKEIFIIRYFADELTRFRFFGRVHRISDKFPHGIPVCGSRHAFKKKIHVASNHGQ